MISAAQPTQTEEKLLLQHYKKAGCLLIRERAHTILLSSQGYTPLDIAGVLEAIQYNLPWKNSAIMEQNEFGASSGVGSK